MTPRGAVADVLTGAAIELGLDRHKARAIALDTVAIPAGKPLLSTEDLELLGRIWAGFLNAARPGGPE